MIEVLNKEKCAGCGACLKVCPTNAIEFYIDEEGFNYPKVKIENCINCGLCEKTCPWLNSKYIDRIEKQKSLFYAAQLKNKSQLNQVSSGGAAWSLALYVFSLGGIVYGAVQENVDVIFHKRCESLDELKKIRRSKYLQSDLRNCYVQAKTDLDDNKLVLFIGTGCQIAGFLSFLKKDYEQLITADVVCHGVPSPKVWKSYRIENEKNQAAKMIELIYRDKSEGWLNNQYAIAYSNGNVVREDSSNNPFHRGYLFGLYSRPSCGACKFNLLPRVSDFTFADYWMYDGNRFKKSLQEGVSLVAVNTYKAENIMQDMNSLLEFELTTREMALKSCRQMNNAPLVSENRTQFWNVYEQQGFHAAWKRYIKERRENPVIKYVKILKNKLCRRIKKYNV